MTEQPVKLERPIRVVLFGSGPRITHDARQFLCRLEAHPEITLAGAFCQSQGQTYGAIFKDLWRRRGLLAFPLFLAWLSGELGHFLSNPGAELALRKTMAQLRDRIHFVPDIHARTVLDHLSSLDPDLGLIYGSPILKPELFERPRFGTLGIHHGKVPDYRGNKTTFWAMYNDEKTAGVTIQKVNAGLDTGQIVKEGEVVIGRRRQRIVWHELEALGLELYLQAILEVKNGTASYQPQSGPKGRLYRNPKFADLLRFRIRQIRRRLTAFRTVKEL
ncbi:MAG: formyltransferase family protein [Anaerolineae bacterium]|nr:formyltransferase family protein [Anaerolineae bacterium]